MSKVVMPGGYSVDSKYALDVPQMRDALEKKGYLTSEVDSILQNMYGSGNDPYAGLTGTSSSSSSQDSAEAMLNATLAGLAPKQEAAEA